MEQIRSFELKSSQYVLTLVCFPDFPFEKLLSDVREKFRRSAKFFRNGQMAISFGGRELTDEQKRRIIDAITESCQLDITCVIESSGNEEREAELIARNINETAENTAALITHSLKNGQRLTFGRTVVILGDVAPGAEVISDGCIVVLGIAMGILRAGASGDEHTFISGTVLKPFELSIASHKAVSGIRKVQIDREYAPDPQVAFLKDDGHIGFLPVTGSLFDEILHPRKIEKGKEE